MEQTLEKTAVVTGAGSGVGRAVALRLAGEGWSVALVGRQAAGLNETRALAGPFADQLFVTPCDISDAKAVEALVEDVTKELGSVSALVNSAGTNIPERGLGVLTVEKFKEIIEINLVGTFICVHAFLPIMRKLAAVRSSTSSRMPDCWLTPRPARHTWRESSA